MEERVDAGGDGSLGLGAPACVHILDGVPATAVRSAKKVVVDLPAPLFRETEWAVKELSINRSNLIRRAVESFVADLRRKKLEEELAAGYIANASQARKAAEDFAHAEADLLL